MSSDICLQRLRKELRQLQKNPVANIRATATEKNLLVWHYVLEGSKGSCYENGFYHGILTFPAAYPYKPPSIQMITPNGRFKTNTRLCLSMSDFHPESWNPLWSVGTILLGVFTFMHENSPTLGSIESDNPTRIKLAKESLRFNCKNKEFCELFPELLELYEKNKKEEATEEAENDDLNNRTLNILPAFIIGICVIILICSIIIYALVSG